MTVSQLWLLVAVNGTEELGEVVTARVCEGGAAEFTELNAKVEGAATRINDGAVTVRFTVTGSGELVAAL